MILSHEEVRKLAEKIDHDTEWRLKDLQALSEAVGMEEEWRAATADNFERVAEEMIRKAMTGEEDEK